jgi:hypothetical protein
MKARIHPDKRPLHWLHKRDSAKASPLCPLKYLFGEREEVYSYYSASQNVFACQRVTMVTETTEMLVRCEAYNVFSDT